jgi:hypothetical protein
MPQQAKPGVRWYIVSHLFLTVLYVGQPFVVFAQISIAQTQLLSL